VPGPGPAAVLTVAEAGRLLRAGVLTSAALTEAALRAADARDAELGVFATRTAEAARAAAAAADRAFAAGVDRGPLQGIPVAVKDVVAVAGVPMRAGSALADPGGPGWPAGDAACVAGLRAAGAVLVGTTTTSELAVGSPDVLDGVPVPPAGGALPRNPWDPDRWTGGSSAGSAAAVATGMALAAVGTDSGGSTRMPAAFCGVTGFKPTHGTVSVDGVLPFAWTTDTVGVLAADALGCAALLAAMAPGLPGPDVGDLAGLRIGWDGLERAGGHLADPAWPARAAAVAAALADAGAEVVPVELPLWDELVTASVVTTLSEALAGLGPDLRGSWGELLPNTRQTVALAAAWSAADYVQAQRVRAAGARAVQALFRGGGGPEVDLLLTPMAARTAISFRRLPEMFASGEWHAVYAPYWNATGNPALSLPAGPGADGLPLAVQLVGPAGGDAAVLAAGAALQARTAWHLTRPPADPPARPTVVPGADEERNP
jgi:aspartyl-tRNA(Asn)/glutamyl-tRNA(Gln) amidotransferase subunit A